MCFEIGPKLYVIPGGMYVCMYVPALSLDYTYSSFCLTIGAGLWYYCLQGFIPPFASVNTNPFQATLTSPHFPGMYVCMYVISFFLTMTAPASRHHLAAYKRAKVSRVQDGLRRRAGIRRGWC